MQIRGRLCDAVDARQVALTGLPCYWCGQDIRVRRVFPLAVVGALLIVLGNVTNRRGLCVTIVYMSSATDYFAGDPHDVLAQVTE
jgi:hypothetical protein